MTSFNEWLQNITKSDIQTFINSHLDTDISDLVFKKNPFSAIDYSSLLRQIEAKKKIKTKLPTWYACSNIIYPSSVSMQQTSSELTANYKSKLVSGKVGIDLTGGFGIDSFYLSKSFENFVYVEKNEQLAQIAKHNFSQLKVANISTEMGDSLQVLNDIISRIDLIYIDPARRDSFQKKVFRFEDCEPNIIENLDFYFEKADQIFIKTSPLLDITLAINQLKYIKTIHIVSVANEMKELLFLLDKNTNSSIDLHLVDLEIHKKINFKYNNQIWSGDYSLPLTYLYLPHATMMKAAQFDILSKNNQLFKLHQHSHLFTSKFIIEDFFGKSFKINEVFPFQKDIMKTHLFKKKINISCRNFPLKPEYLKTKWQIKDGGEDYVFFSTNLKNEKIVLFCTKL